MWDKLTRKEKIEDIMNNIKQNKQANSTEITEEIMLEIEEITEKEKASTMEGGGPLQVLFLSQMQSSFLNLTMKGTHQ